MSNNKIGLSYYNIDTDRYQDIKIKRLKKDFGCSGIAVYDYILCEIYRVKGYFLVWDENTAFDVADYFGLKETLVKDIVDYCCAVGLFDKELLTSEKILTSSSIQLRYIEMCNRAKRINIKIQEEYSKLREVCPKKEEVCRKVKESKERKESTKVDKKSAAKAATHSPEERTSPAKDIDKINYQGVVDYFNSTFKGKLPVVTCLTEKRKAAIKARISNHGKNAVMEVFQKALNSSFLMGENDKNWRVDFDWIFKPTNFIKILEGNYDGNNKNSSVPKSGKINSDKESGSKPNTDTAGFEELINIVRIG